jgi:hypothetical protein
VEDFWKGLEFRRGRWKSGCWGLKFKFHDISPKIQGIGLVGVVSWGMTLFLTHIEFKWNHTCRQCLRNIWLYTPSARTYVIGGLDPKPVGCERLQARHSVWGNLRINSLWDCLPGPRILCILNSVIPEPKCLLVNCLRPEVHLSNVERIGFCVTENTLHPHYKTN